MSNLDPPLTNSQKVTMNFYAQLNYIALTDKDDRITNYPSFQYKNQLDLYTIDTTVNTDDYYLCYPINEYSNNPIYFVCAGTHTTTMFSEALSIGMSNTDIETLSTFNNIKDTIANIKSTRPELFKNGQREYIIKSK